MHAHTGGPTFQHFIISTFHDLQIWGCTFQHFNISRTLQHFNISTFGDPMNPGSSGPRHFNISTFQHLTSAGCGIDGPSTFRHFNISWGRVGRRRRRQGSGAPERRGGGGAAAAGPGGALPPRTPPRRRPGCERRKGGIRVFNFQCPSTSFKGGARMVNGTLNRSRKRTLNRPKQNIP